VGLGTDLDVREVEISLRASNLQALLLEMNQITTCEEGNRNTAMGKFGPVVQTESSRPYDSNMGVAGQEKGRIGWHE
jgi:hypothetical protein